MKKIEIILLKIRLLILIIFSLIKTGVELIKLYRVIIIVLALIGMVFLSLLIREIQINLKENELKSKVQTWQEIQKIQPNSEIINQHVWELKNSLQKIKNEVN